MFAHKKGDKILKKTLQDFHCDFTQKLHISYKTHSTKFSPEILGLHLAVRTP